MNPSEEPSRLPSPLDAIPDMRSTARWTVAALGAVGTVLLGVVPVSALGKLHGTTDITIAATGLALGIAGVSWAIWHTAEALTPPVTTLFTIESSELAPLRAIVKRWPESFYGPFGSSVTELVRQRRLHDQVAINLAEAAAMEKDADRRRTLERVLADARANADLARSLQRQLLEFAHAWQVRAALRRARLHTVMAVGVILLGTILVMIAAANPD